MGEGDPQELYTFNRDFLLKVAHMAHGQFAQLIKARGPNTHVDAACAGTTQAVLLARDWIRTGRARRVIVVAADDVAGKALLPWVGAGFLAMGAATTNANISEAAARTSIDMSAMYLTPLDTLSSLVPSQLPS